MTLHVRTPHLRRFVPATGGEVNMSCGRPLAEISGAGIARDTAAVCVDGVWFIRPDSAELRRIEGIWRAAKA